MIRLHYSPWKWKKPKVYASYEHEGSIENGYGKCPIQAIYDAIRKHVLFGKCDFQRVGIGLDGRTNGLPTRTANGTLWQAHDQGATAEVEPGLALQPQAAD